MKSKLLLLSLGFFVCFTFQIHAQWSSHTFEHDGLTRGYMVYLPDNYPAEEPSSLILTLHGLGGNMQEFSQTGFDEVADSTNYVVVSPQAVADFLAGTAWNSRAGIFGYYPNSDVDDIGFLNSLVDYMIDHYSINPDQVYMTGFSMGGFMTQRMACESNEKFRAFASVAGTIGSGISACNPGRAIPVAHFHGTSDEVVGYYENTFGMNVDDLIALWTQNNNTSSIPIETEFPDSAPDGLTVDHFLYTDGNEDVELYRVNGAFHSWLRTPGNDIDYPEEIIRFFNKTHTLLATEDIAVNDILVYPNPVKEDLFIQLPIMNPSEKYEISLYSMDGKQLYRAQFFGSESLISMEKLNINSGVYILFVNGNNFNFSKKILVK